MEHDIALLESVADTLCSDTFTHGAIPGGSSASSRRRFDELITTNPPRVASPPAHPGALLAQELARAMSSTAPITLGGGGTSATLRGLSPTAGTLLSSGNAHHSPTGGGLPKYNPAKETLRGELGAALNHLYTSESMLIAVHSRRRQEVLRANVESRELDCAKIASEITEFRKALGNIKSKNLRDRGTAELKTYREWLQRQITRIREILDTRSSNLEEQSLCCVCFEADRSVLLRPCSHLALCEKCSKKVETCPICRSRITSRITVKIS
ncbi:unnamed protein product [Amoebophrya sp. A25]|nr:unnamed protein product [Amoebophrya sp. A25]|eukprot:GSA25T00005691001.1